MGNRFFNGLVFGTGFAIAFVIILFVAIFVVFPVMTNRGVVVYSGQETVLEAPRLKEEIRFLGSLGRYDGEFAVDIKQDLSTGPGRILGTASVNGEPLSGFRLLLALNGKVMSQWAMTDANGQYEIGVPYGEYRIDGYEIDIANANEVLAGKIDHPYYARSDSLFEVSENETGRGLTFRFVDPVRLDIPKTKFSPGEEVVIAWHAYPGATEYQVQVTEQTDPHTMSRGKSMFPWSQRPKVKEPFINLSDFIDLKPGHFYRVDVDALRDGWSPISNTENRYSATDFEITD